MALSTTYFDPLSPLSPQVSTSSHYSEPDVYVSYVGVSVQSICVFRKDVRAIFD